MSSCTLHREFLVAVADGETELVPAATLDHVKSCADCAREVRTHRLLTSRLRDASELPEEPTRRRRPIALPRRSGFIAAAIAAVTLVAAAAAGWSVISRPDPVQAAVNASSRPMQIESTDPSQIGQWCLHASGRELPAVQLDGMQIVGARMDRAASTDIVSVTYTGPSVARVTVSWLEGQAPPGSGVEDRNMSGQELLIVHSRLGTAVITGSSVDAMWEMAASIESTAA